MARVDIIDPAAASGDRKQILDEIHSVFGVTPAMFRAVANSPAALRSMWGSFGALGDGVIPATFGEKIAVAIANENRCEYCLAAHTLLGQQAGAGADEMAEAQAGRSDDPATAAALAFALQMVRSRAQVDDAQVNALRDVGFNDEEIVEIVAHVALNVFTNYINVALAVPLDFPSISLTPVAV